MKTEVMIYEGNEIRFTLEKNEKMMLNATEMAKPFGKLAKDFLLNNNTQAFIASCLKRGNSPFLDIETEGDLYVSRQKSGTWMHRILALKFAAWLNPDFEVWVYSTIEELLFGRHQKREESLQRSYDLQKEREMLRYKFNKTVDDFDRYLEIEQILKCEQARRKALTNELIGGFEQPELPFGGLEQPKHLFL